MKEQRERVHIYFTATQRKNSVCFKTLQRIARIKGFGRKIAPRNVALSSLTHFLNLTTYKAKIRFGGVDLYNVDAMEKLQKIFLLWKVVMKMLDIREMGGLKYVQHFIISFLGDEEDLCI